MFQKKQSKYGNIKTRVDGFLFDSRRESLRYKELNILEKNGNIEHLQMQVPYQIEVNGIKICKYVCDFRYLEKDRMVVEDCKGMKTSVYQLKKKLMKACFGITILET